MTVLGLPAIPAGAGGQLDQHHAARHQRPVQRALHRQPDAAQARALLGMLDHGGPRQGGPAPMRRTAGRGAVILESAMWIPIMVFLLVGMVEIARVTYTYYSLHKMLYTIARLVGTGQGTNFCSDQNIGARHRQLRVEWRERRRPADHPIAAGRANRRCAWSATTRPAASWRVCECSATGCDTEAGGRPPDYVVVSIPDGYPMRLAIPGLNLDPIPLRPQVRVPYGGYVASGADEAPQAARPARSNSRSSGRPSSCL